MAHLSSLSMGPAVPCGGALSWSMLRRGAHATQVPNVEGGTKAAAALTFQYICILPGNSCMHCCPALSVLPAGSLIPTEPGPGSSSPPSTMAAAEAAALAAAGTAAGPGPLPITTWPKFADTSSHHTPSTGQSSQVSPGWRRTVAWLAAAR